MGEYAADSSWLVKTKGKINFLELFCSAAVASETCAEGGLSVGEPIDILGHDLSGEKGQGYVWHLITTQKPDVVFIGIPCTPWSHMQNINDPSEVERKREEALPLLKFSRDVAKHQLSTGKWFLIENPATSAIWKTRQFREITALQGVSWDSAELCMHGLRAQSRNCPTRRVCPSSTTLTQEFWLHCS